MNTLISNCIYVNYPTQEVVDWCNKNLVLDNPLFQQMEKMGRIDTIRRCHIPEKIRLYYAKENGSVLILPFGCLHGIWDLIKIAQVDLNFSKTNYVISNHDLPTPLPLFDYQEDAINALLKARGGVLCSGCGSGKTITAIELIKRIGKPFLWICGTKDLLRQAKKDFLALYPNMNIGTITDGEVNMGKDGTISTIQTLCKIDPKIYSHDFSVIMVDECHKVSSNVGNMRMYQKVLNNLNARYKYGLSATPFRSDTLTNTIYMNLGMSPEGKFEPTYIVDKSRINTMTADFVSINTGMQWNNQFLEADGTFNYKNLIDYLSTNEDRNKKIMLEACAFAKEGRKIAILTNRVEQCVVLQKLIQENGVKAIAVTGATSDTIRKKALEDDINSWQVIISTLSLFKEGLDIKALDTVIMAVPIKDKAGIIQSCGRCERKLEGKEKQPLFVAMQDEGISYCVNAIKKMKSYIKNR